MLKNSPYFTDSTINFLIKNNLDSWKKTILGTFGTGKLYPPGTIFSRSGQLNKQVFYLVSGLVKVYTSNPEGYQRLLGYHQDNTLFALDCLRGKDEAVVSTSALRECQVITISGPELKDFLFKHPQFAYDLLLYEQDVLRLMCFDAEIQSNSSVTSRLSSFVLIYMSSEHYRKTLMVNLSQTEIASAINASRIQVARVEEKMQKKGLIAINRRGIKIIDFRALEKLKQDPQANLD